MGVTREDLNGNETMHIRKRGGIEGKLEERVGKRVL